MEAIKKKDADYAEKLANAHVMHVMENLGQSNKENRHMEKIKMTTRW